MHAMILAAGLGTRLAPITDSIPKPLVPVVGVPTIELHIRRLAEFGFKNIVINTHHLARNVREALEDGSRFGVAIAYSHEPELLGTGGGIKKALPLLGDKDFLVVNADALFAPDYDRILDAHFRAGAAATMVVRRSPRALDYGAVRVDPHGRVRSIIGQGALDDDAEPTMFTGVHILSQRFAGALPDTGCIVRESYIPLLRDGEHVQAFVDEGYFCDLGTPDRYLRANLDLLTGRARLAGFEPPRRSVHIGADVDLSPEATLGNEVVLCDGCRVDASSHLERCVILPKARVQGAVRDCIVMGDGRKIGKESPP